MAVSELNMAYCECHRWSLRGLIEAFLELALAYCLMCGSVFVFLASKFLRACGLYLPCPCSGIFGYRNSDLCLHKLLFYWPLGKIHAIRKLAVSNLPLHLVWHGDPEQSSSSVLLNDTKSEIDVKLDDKEIEFDVKGKKITSLKQKAPNRRRRKVALGYRKSSSALLDHNMQPVVAGVSSSPNDSYQTKSEISENRSEIVNGFQDELNGDLNVGSGDLGSEANMVKMFEQVLWEEKAAPDALYLELEKERAAAATAADEAMAMILRLQADKAALEMEAKQYKRMIEVEFAYDEEEMNILKEILVRRDMERHVLEKALEDLNRNLPSRHNSVERMEGKENPIEDSNSICQGLTDQTAQTCSSIEKSFSCGKYEPEKDGKPGSMTSFHGDSSSPDGEPHVLDVHVIEDKTELRNEGYGGENPRSDAEIEWLRERLRSVQKEKEELTYSAEYMERVTAQLKLMDEIVNQLREIEHQREAGLPAASPSSCEVQLRRSLS